MAEGADTGLVYSLELTIQTNVNVCLVTHLYFVLRPIVSGCN